MRSLQEKFETVQRVEMQDLRKELVVQEEYPIPPQVVRRATKVRKTRRTRKNYLKL